MGSVDSPFLTIITVNHNLDHIIEKEPKLADAAQSIKKYLYVDGLIGATCPVAEATKLRKDMKRIFAMMKMQITK